MSEHRAQRRQGRSLGSVRVRAALGLGVLAMAFTGGSFAFWTDSVPISGGTFTSGTLDLQVNGADTAATTTLAMPQMVPGSASAEVVTVRNHGTAPLRYAVSGGLTGADASAYGTAAALRLTIVRNGTRSGSGSTATCTGGSVLVASVALTTVTSTAVLALQGPLAAATTDSLCVKVELAADAPSTLQGRTAVLALTATGTSDVG